MLTDGTRGLVMYARILASLLVVATWVAVATSPANAVTFAASPSSPVATGGDSPSAVVVGDFNADGKQDLAVANGASENVSVLLGDGAGGFSPAAGSPFAVDGHPNSVAVADFNGDGRPDLAVADASDLTGEESLNNVSILLGNASGGFTALSSPLAAGFMPESVVSGDFNGDGHQDLAVANYFDYTVTVLLGDGTAGFAPAPGSPFSTVPLLSTLPPSRPDSLVVSDFSMDGVLDLAVAGDDGASATAAPIAVLVGDGTGAFTATSTGEALGLMPVLAVGDFNGDARPDLVVASGGRNALEVIINASIGGFGSGPMIGTDCCMPWSVTVADFNADGRQDTAVLLGSGWAAVSVFLGNGVGGFTETSGWSGHDGSGASITTGDVNGDGLPDLVVANGQSPGTVSVLLNVLAAPTATTGSATGVDTASATLNGQVSATDPDFDTRYHFEYGTTTTYGLRAPASDVTVRVDSAGQAVSQALTGLSPGTAYHYRLVASNAAGPSYGADATFTTAAVIVPPPMKTKPANSVAPVITGTTTVGQLLSASSGVWTGNPAPTLSYQWERLTNGWTILVGATGSSYRLTAGDIGRSIRVLVTATNSEGSWGTPSRQVGPIAPSAAQITATLLPQLTPSGPSARIPALLRAGAYTHRVTMLSAGRITIGWWYRRTLVATGTKAVTHSGQTTVKVTLTAAGRRLLRHARTLRLTVRGTCTLAGWHGVTATRTSTVKR
jgi:hypothetical protein